MTVKTICQECHTPNPPGSKFCSNCGARLPKSTSILCPRCQTPNPSSNFYCDKCGSRLVQEETPPPSETPAEEDLPTSAKMFSLPTRKPGDTGELNADNVMDWLRSGQTQIESDESGKPETGKLPRLSDLTPEQRGKTADLPAWLVDSENEEFLIEAPEDITTEHFLNMVQQIDDEERRKLSGMLSDPAITGKGGKLPDWLQDFVQSVEEEKEAAAKPSPQPPPPPETPEPDDDDLEWLAELGPLNTDILARPKGLGGDELPDGPAESDLPDWLDDFQPPNTEMLARPSAPNDEPSVDAILSGQDVDVPDWLAAGNAPDTDSLSRPNQDWADDEIDEEPEDFPDWLMAPPDTSALEQPPQPEPDEAFTTVNTSAQKSVSDWLTGFEEEEEQEVELAEADFTEETFAAPPVTEEKVRKSLTDWLNELDMGEAETDEDSAEAAANLSAWLTEKEPDEVEADHLSFGETGPLPDWLDELEPASETPDAEQPTFVSGMLEDILGPAADIYSAAEPEAVVEPEGEFSAEDHFAAEDEPLRFDEEPDWLSELAAFDPNDLVAQETAVSDAQTDEFKAFDEAFELEDAPQEAAAMMTAVSADDQTDLADDDAEWADLDAILTGVDAEDETADWLEQLDVPAEGAFDSGLLADDEAEKPLISTGELPEWIASMRPGDADQQDSLLPSVLPAASDDLYAITDDLADTDLPDWLQDTDIAKPEKTAVPLASAELPVWIDTESDLGEPSSELESILAELPPALPPEEMLQKAEIPEWIQNLKPAELTGKAAADVDFKLETTGPLAGMPGVIKVEPIVAMPRAISPAAQFSITKEQQQQASLLRQLVQEEQQPVQSGVERPVTAGRSGLRFLLALLLLAAVAVALFGPNFLAGNIPTTVPPAAEAVYTAVNAAAGQPVLIAFDYTPAMAGELDHEARLLLNQLQQNNSPILITSQSAAGTAVAANLTASLNTPIIPLGMIAGESIGLRQLAGCVGQSQQPCQTLQGRGLSTEAQSALQNVALIIVLTGERTSLVNWVEQVSAANNIPVAAGVTQALGPLTAPYYASGQLLGYLDGLPATVALANSHGALANMPGAQRQYEAQSLILLAAAFLLLAGAVVMAAAKKPSKQGS